jgi:hypothetical protein
MKTETVVTALLLATMFQRTSIAQQWRPNTPPPFDSLPVHSDSVTERVAVDLTSHRDARRFRTMLREGARKGVNFAGHFALVTWGCGTDCRQLAIIEARSGRVFFAAFTLERAPHFRTDSRLLAIDPYGSAFSEDDLPGPRFQMRYVWDGTSLVLRDSAAMTMVKQR